MSENERKPVGDTIRRVLDLTMTVAVLVAAMAVVWQVWRNYVPSRGPSGQQNFPTRPIRTDGLASKGSVNARVAMLEYSDFECSYCGRFSRDTLPQIEKEYVETGMVRLIFRHLPLPQLHPHAQKSAEAAECAADQGAFWQFHDWAFRNASDLSMDGLRRAAVDLNLEPSSFSECLDGRRADKVLADAKSAELLKIGGTPSFLFGAFQPDGQVIFTEGFSGAKTLDEFRKILQRLIAAH